MDEKTVKYYDTHAKEVVARHLTIEPGTELALKFFTPGAPTADIGCGSGRDTEWLCEQGFAAEGFDASEGMLREARKHYPKLRFSHASLPSLSELSDAAYKNVLLAAVLMHLPAEELELSCQNLIRIMKSGGHLVLSFRVGHTDIEAADRERLFTPIEPTVLSAIFDRLGASVVHHELEPDSTRSQITWHLMVVRKP